MSPDSAGSLGEFLRHEREKRGITIEQVASATKISVRLLHSLEGDIYAELPAKPFIRGFVTSYARFIGLEPKEILTRFGRFIDEKAMDRPSRDSGHEGYAFEKREGDQSRRTLWIVMGVFLVIGVIALILKPSLRGGRHRHADKLKGAHSEPTASPNPVSSPSSGPSPVPSLSPRAEAASQPSHAPSPLIAMATPSPSASPQAKPSPKPSPSPQTKPSPKPSPSPRAKPSPKPSPSPQAKPSPDASPQPTASGSPQADASDPLHSGKSLKPAAIKERIVIQAKTDVWVRFRCDERPLTRFILRKDRTLVLRAERQIVFQVSDPAGVSIRSNTRGNLVPSTDKTLKVIGDTGTLGFPPKALETAEEFLSPEKPLPKSVPSRPGT